MRTPRRLTSVATILSLALVPTVFSGDSTGLIPLMDMQPGQMYQGFPGGLYPQNRNTLPTGHLAGGLHQALAIRPLDASGQPSPTGRIVLLSIGMSNTSQESTAFAPLFTAYADRNPAVQFVNGAQGGQTAAIISNPNANFWTVIDQRLAQAGVTAAQVQALWYKEADAGPTSGFPAYANTLRDESRTIMGIIKNRYPNARIVYTSSRIYAGYATTMLNPEPYAYESGFSMKWLIELQITGDPALNYRPGGGPVVAPFVQWGPYLWADGVLPRSDGLTWVIGDFANDGTHPSQQGAAKVGNLLLNFLINSPTSRVWFVRPQLQTLLGDLNGDRTINNFDIDAFVLALTNPTGFAQQYPNVDRIRAGDVNQDGVMNNFDIDPFVALLVAF